MAQVGPQRGNHLRGRRRAAAALAAACLSLSATPALAADTVGDTQAEFGKHVSVQQPRIGDTPAEFGELFASAGLKLGRIVTTPTPISVIETLPA